MSSGGTTIRDIMVKHVHTVSPETDAISAAQMMARAKIRHLIVIEDTGEVAGVLSQREILKHFSPWLSHVRAELGTRTEPPRVGARMIMSKPPITVTGDTPIRVAAHILASKKIGCLPVVDGDKHVVGILSTVDLLLWVGRYEGSEPKKESKREEGFCVFQAPAFISKDRELSVPLSYFPDTNFEKGVLALLAYSADGNRIGVKLFAKGNQTEGLRDARPASINRGYVAIPAGDFLDHHKLRIHGSLKVTTDTDTGYVVLSPMLSHPFKTPTQVYP